jgi:hypothetical protein
MPRHRDVAALLAVVLLGVAGCGSDDRDPSRGGAPAVTVGDQPYELGGGDGSGADGDEDRDERGGIAGGPDTPSPIDRPGGDIQPGEPSEPAR